MSLDELIVWITSPVGALILGGGLFALLLLEVLLAYGLVKKFKKK